MAETFLLEIGLEELPARAVGQALTQLRDEFARMMGTFRLSHGEIRTLGTPRRLALLVTDLAEGQPDREVTVQGPPKQACFAKDGQPSKALLGFAAAQGVEPSEVVFVETDKGERASVTAEEKGHPAAEVLAEILPKLVLCPSFPKSLRWAHRKTRYGRPIRWLIALLGSDAIAFAIEDIESGRTSRGHRFLGHASVEIPNADAYVETMRAEGVLVDIDERRAAIREQVRTLAAEAGGEPLHLEQVLEENLELVEWPTAFLGSFDESFLELPSVVPTTVCRKHQKYFPLADKAGRLLPRFIAVRNGDARGIDNVRAGNEIVVGGRLRDAVFFFGNDVKRPLAERVPDLDRVTFIRGLGTLGEKTKRLVALSGSIAGALGLEQAATERLGRAALLAKADLTTSLVIEFTELQGVLGSVYAERSGEEPAVARAIAEHYQPAGADDALPATLEGALLSIADRVDSVIGVLSIGEAPTGTADPHGVRRRVQGAAAIVLHRALPLDLTAVAEEALALYGKEDRAPLGLFEQLLRQRAEAVLEADGVELELRQAVSDLPVSRLGQALAVSRAIRALDAEDPELLTAAWRAATRPSNIAVKRLGDRTEVNTALFEDPAEQTLLEAAARVEDAANAFDKALAEAPLEGRFEAVERATRTALAAFAEEADVVDRYFEAVMVMAEDPDLQANRLALCYRLTRAFRRVASLDYLSRM
jgi:glycyl-tRNA synthetase beta chain